MSHVGFFTYLCVCVCVCVCVCARARACTLSHSVLLFTFMSCLCHWTESVLEAGIISYSLYPWILAHPVYLECVCVCAQSCLRVCNPVDCSLPGSSAHGIFQARILEWVAISSSRGSSRPWDQTLVSCISCIGRWIHHHCTTWETPFAYLDRCKLHAHIVLTVCLRLLSVLQISCCSIAKSSPTLRPHGLQHARLVCPPLSPGVCSNSCPLSQCFR